MIEDDIKNLRLQFSMNMEIMLKNLKNKNKEGIKQGAKRENRYMEVYQINKSKE